MKKHSGAPCALHLKTDYFKKEGYSMKKTIAVLLAGLMALFLLTGCGTGNSSAPAAASAASGTSDARTPSFQTMGDVLSYEENRQYAYDENYYVYVFEMDGTCYRAVGELTAEVSEALKHNKKDDLYAACSLHDSCPLSPPFKRTVTNISFEKCVKVEK